MFVTTRQELEILRCIVVIYIVGKKMKIGEKKMIDRMSLPERESLKNIKIDTYSIRDIVYRIKKY